MKYNECHRCYPGACLSNSQCTEQTTADASCKGVHSGGLTDSVHMDVLRDPISRDILKEPGFYFGTSTGEVYASTDVGESCKKIASGLGRIWGITAFSPMN